MRNGLFIVFEGIDGCGKGIQIELLKKWLIQKGHRVKVAENPSFSITGHMLRIALKADRRITPEADALFFAADRVQMTEELVKPGLQEGAVVLCERYILSSLTYQTSFGVDEEWIKELNKFIIEPDITFVFDLSPEESLKRRFEEVFHESKAIEKFEKLDFLKKVREKYLELAQKEKNTVVVNASKTPEEIHSEILQHVERLLNERKANNL